VWGCSLSAGSAAGECKRASNRLAWQWRGRGAAPFCFPGADLRVSVNQADSLIPGSAFHRTIQFRTNTVGKGRLIASGVCPLPEVGWPHLRQGGREKKDWVPAFGAVISTGGRDAERLGSGFRRNDEENKSFSEVPVIPAKARRKPGPSRSTRLMVPILARKQFLANRPASAACLPTAAPFRTPPPPASRRGRRTACRRSAGRPAIRPQ
jgi:hypothetical protein